MDLRAERGENKQKKGSRSSSIGIISTQQLGTWKSHSSTLTPRPGTDSARPTKAGSPSSNLEGEKQATTSHCNRHPSIPSPIADRLGRRPRVPCSISIHSGNLLQHLLAAHPTSNLQHPASAVRHPGHLPCASRFPSPGSCLMRDTTSWHRRRPALCNLACRPDLVRIPCSYLPYLLQLDAVPCRAAATAAWLPDLSTDGDWGTI